MQALDLAECGLQAVPLRLVLFAADGFGDGVFEDAVVVPELEFLERGAAGEELEVVRGGGPGEKGHGRRERCRRGSSDARPA